MDVGALEFRALVAEHIGGGAVCEGHQAGDIIVQTGRGSVSLLQRRLNVGYSRASRLVDQLYEAGIVGEYKGSQAREVIVTREEWLASRAQRDREEAAEEAEKLASDIAVQKLGYRDIRDRRTALKELIGRLRGQRFVCLSGEERLVRDADPAEVPAEEARHRRKGAGGE